jgi:hypothetical protein
MSDYLTRMAARSLGLMPLAKPRVPSNYAATQAATDLDKPIIEPEMSLEDVEPHTESSSVNEKQGRLRPEREQQKPRTKQTMDRLTVISEPESAAHTTEKKVKVNSLQGSERVESKIVVRVHDDQLAKGEAKLADSKLPSSTQPAPLRSLTRNESVSVTPLPTDGNTPIKSPGTIIYPKEAHATHNEKPGKGTIETRREAAATFNEKKTGQEISLNLEDGKNDDKKTSIHAVTKIPTYTPNELMGKRTVEPAGSFTPAQLSRRTPSDEQQRPIIRVTIGRVEVRSIQPSPPQPPPKVEAPPIQSLSEYLKKRDEGHP